MSNFFKTPKLPPPEPPVRVPVENSASQRETARRRRGELVASRGRQSTNLTGDFSSDFLGQ